MAVPKAQPEDDLTRARWERVEAAFHAALEGEAGQRREILDRHCGGDTSAREEVETLLEAETAARGFVAGIVQGALESLPEEFTGTERFAVRRKLGRGGFGAVYEVYDRKEAAVVALKALRRVNAEEIYRLKHEFRSLADISHPNLISLYELFAERDDCFFTMELLEGESFLDYVRPGGETFDLGRLRAAMGQLATGISALHRAGKLHMDLKPSNVLVTLEGRVVVVDFGLAADVGGNESLGSPAGTPAYMAPEQLKEGRASPASDWFSVGVMLFESLTGQLPLVGELNDEVPSDLDRLCRALLEPDPANRPKEAEVLAALGASVGVEEGIEYVPFVGRKKELALLLSAFSRLREGAGGMICVTGAAGTGKTALVEEFLRLAREEDSEAVVLAGRCYEQESVAYNAWDEMVDALAVHLNGLPEPTFAALMDEETLAAARLFPVLRPVRWAPVVEIESPEIRQASFEAFRCLLRRLADRAPLVIFLDDLQRGDADSLRLLANVMRPPGDPRMMFIASYTNDGEVGLEGFTERIELGLELARQPELARRVTGMPAAAQRLLEVLAIARHPVEAGTAWKAAHQEGARQAALASLRTNRLIRARGSTGERKIEVYHDRVGEAVRAQMPPEAIVERNLSLAMELEATRTAAPQSLAYHFEAGGDRARAFRYSVEAGDQECGVLAFESAANWYRRALGLGRDGDGVTIRRKLADALSSAGRGVEAAALYRECAAASGPAAQMFLRQRAATEYLISGHAQEGLRALEEVLAAIGMRMPRNGRRAIPGFLLRRGMIRLRGLGFQPREADAMSAWQVSQVDACWSVAQGLAMADTARAAAFHARHLLLALRIGDPYRAARGLAVEAGYQATGGTRTERKTAQILGRARQVAEACGNPHAIGLAMLVGGVSAFLEGRWAAARNNMEEAERFLKGSCAGVAWELATARLMGCVSQFFLGDVQSLGLRLPVLLASAKSRGDRYESTDLQIRIAHAVELAADRPESAQALVDDAISRWPADAYYLQHWWAMVAGIEIALYRGDGEGAWRLVNRNWAPLRRSLLLHIQYVRLESLFHRALAALAVGEIEVAIGDAQRMEKDKARWGTALAWLIRAGAAGRVSKKSEAEDYLARAEAELETADMRLFAAAARRKRGLVQEADGWMSEQGIKDPGKMAAMLAGS